MKFDSESGSRENILEFLLLTTIGVLQVMRADFSEMMLVTPKFCISDKSDSLSDLSKVWVKSVVQDFPC